ncbi:MAG: aminotransferase class III-fold pyridoxal phosphate-dependent enzyme [Hyphomonadaceae bacterium]|nr:aminotransferase class III-fold pyridoxal phosphate-dependent enzyme [Hyphomonadaceae bacterium]
MSEPLKVARAAPGSERTLLAERWSSAAPGSARLAAEARRLAPGGASHDARQMNPHGVFIASAQGGVKIDVDGRRYVDLVSGHGAILMGHAREEILAAVHAAADAGFHFGAASENEIRWAELVQTLIPSAERVRFTASGSEASLLALVLSVRCRRRPPVLTLKGHYAGWAAGAAFERVSPQRAMALAPEAFGPVVVEADCAESASELLASGAFAALLVEPTGASFGKAPLPADALVGLVEAARAGETLVIFDETITGFRVAPGGAQAALGVAPDLTILGKILGGGLPCGALAGRAEIMDLLDNSPSASDRPVVLSHMGTANGNPVVAAAGVATLQSLRDGAACAQAEKSAAALRAALNEAFARKQLAWAAYGAFSGVHLFLNPYERGIDSASFDVSALPSDELLRRDGVLINALRIALLTEGVDINPWPGGLTTAAHTGADIEAVATGVERAIDALREARLALTGWGAA